VTRCRPYKAVRAEKRHQDETVAKGSSSPSDAIRPTVRAASRCSSRRISAPAANINNMRPSWEIAPMAAADEP